MTAPLQLGRPGRSPDPAIEEIEIEGWLTAVLIPREPGPVDDAYHDQASAEIVMLNVSRSEALLLVDGLRSIEYWDYATELDLPRRNGQVFLPEDDGSWWGEAAAGSDEEHAIEQIRILRALAARVESQVSGE